MLLRVDHGRADLLGSNSITHSLSSSPRVDGVEADSTRRRADADSMVAVEQTSRRWRVLCIDANLMAPGRDSVDAVEAGRSSTATATDDLVDGVEAGSHAVEQARHTCSLSPSVSPLNA